MGHGRDVLGLAIAPCVSQPPATHPQPLPGQVFLWRKVLRKQGFFTLAGTVLSQDSVGDRGTVPRQRRSAS